MFHGRECADIGLQRVTVRNGRFRIERGYDPSVRIPEEVRDCVGFVGEVVHRDSSGISGDLHATGFFVSVACKSPELQGSGLSACYFVTAKHVAEDLKDREVYFLVNKVGGGVTEIKTIYKNKWFFHPTDKAVDVAVAQIFPQSNAVIVPVKVEQFGTPERITELGIGIGDEVFATGLFTLAPGTARNMPIIRHGNIAMMPEEPIQTELGYADVYLVEARSIGGLSGSPVFVRNTLSQKVTLDDDSETVAFMSGTGITLLGLMHGHWDIKESEMNKALFEHDSKRGVNLGIGIVVPAIKILETINQPELEEIRMSEEKRVIRRIVPGMDSAKPKESEPAATQTFTKNDFESALKKASSKIKK
jgi:hypothetical protein